MEYLITCYWATCYSQCCFLERRVSEVLVEEVHCYLEEQLIDAFSLGTWYPVKTLDIISIAKMYPLLQWTQQKTFSQPAQNGGCPKQPHFCCLFFTQMSSQRLSASPKGSTWLTGLVKDLLFFLRMMFQIVFCFCHILFSYPNQYSQSACRFHMPQLVNLFFYCFCPGHQELFFPFRPSIMCAWGLLRW